MASQVTGPKKSKPPKLPPIGRELTADNIEVAAALRHRASSAGTDKSVNNGQ